MCIILSWVTGLFLTPETEDGETEVLPFASRGALESVKDEPKELSLTSSNAPLDKSDGVSKL
jgi:hypothetical protein